VLRNIKGTPAAPIGRVQANRQEIPMRLPLVPLSDMSPEQRALYGDMREGIGTNFKGFTAINDSGELIGPWDPWLRFPKFGGPVWNLVKALSSSPSLPRAVREVAILVTGAKFRAAYEIYAHVLVAELRGLSDEKIATIVAGQRPNDLTREEAIAYDVASSLVSGGVLPTLTYRQAVTAFGEDGTAEFIYLVGLYCMVSVTLNGFDVPVPEEVESK
jgi:4-carboxymuconolactone decarboxylase